MSVRLWQSISKKRPSHFVIPSLRSRASSERSEGSLPAQRSFAALRMTILKRFRLTRKTSSLKWIGRKGRPALTPVTKFFDLLAMLNRVVVERGDKVVG